MTKINIDNTQYKAYTKCPLYWKEKYLNKVHKPVEGPRNDALAIGVHFHSALENVYSGKGFKSSEEVYAEYPLTPEAELEVMSMVEAYRVMYPGGPVEFNWIGLEDVLKKPSAFTGITFLAKLDGYFEVTELTKAQDGLGGEIVLTPGIYGFETKTKLPRLDRGLYMKEWQADMQASFQIMTLEHTLGKSVNGILVNVIERPNVYQPRKTCNGCKELLPTYMYKIENSVYRCIRCGHGNQFKASQIPEPRVDPPVVWRFVVERSKERLTRDRYDINTVAQLIQNKWFYANRQECVKTYQRKTCEYFEPHNAIVPVEALGWPGFVEFNPTQYLETNKETIDE